jgi:hypothetical protein
MVSAKEQLMERRPEALVEFVADSDSGGYGHALSENSKVNT